MGGLLRKAGEGREGGRGEARERLLGGCPRFHRHNERLFERKRDIGIHLTGLRRAVLLCAVFFFLGFVLIEAFHFLIQVFMPLVVQPLFCLPGCGRWMGGWPGGPGRAGRACTKHEVLLLCSVGFSVLGGVCLHERAYRMAVLLCAHADRTQCYPLGGGGCL